MTKWKGDGPKATALPEALVGERPLDATGEAFQNLGYTRRRLSQSQKARPRCHRCRPRTHDYLRPI